MPARRLTLAVLLTAALAPGLWWRTEPRWPQDNHRQDLSVARISAATPASWPAGLRLVGAWQMTSSSNRFGGYSALLPAAGGTLTAISDLGFWLRFAPPGAVAAGQHRLGRVWSRQTDWSYSDIEAATGDPQTGEFWLAYERTNLIRRFGSGNRTVVAVAPRAMRHWVENGGAESLTRLPDGRFIVLQEDAPALSAGGRMGLLFPSDPVSGAEPLKFTFRPPIGYSPSDMAALPDGRVVILLRSLDFPFPPFFKGMLVVADPNGIAAGRDWPWRKLADLVDPVRRENYEGLAIVPDGSGVTMWLISGDNFSRFQRTLLLQLHWQLPAGAAAAG